MKKLALLFVALFCVSAFADDLPRIAVYVTGNVGDDEKKALGTRMLASLVNSGRYKGIERTNSFLAEIEKEQVKQMSGDIDDSQISALGKQFGVKFVCIADITPVLGDFQVSARIVNVETAEVEFIGESASPLKSITDLARVSDQVVKNMFEKQTDNTPERPAEYAVQTKQENVKPGSARAEKERERQRQTSKYDESIDFTTGERWGTWALNIIPGLGSAVIMKDTKGTIINALIGGGGIVLYGSGLIWILNNSGDDNILANIIGGTGLILLIPVGITWNIYRSATYHHPDSRKIAVNPLQGVNFAVLPDQDGNIKGYVAYRVEF